MSARDLPDEAARAAELVARVRLQFLAPPPLVDVAQWAGKFRHIAKGPERGQWRNERTPYLVEPMQCASAHAPYNGWCSGSPRSWARAKFSTTPSCSGFTPTRKT